MSSTETQPDFESLAKVCIDGVCHCDWRLTLQDCVEAKAMTIIHGLNVGLSGVSIIIGIWLELINLHPFFINSDLNRLYIIMPQNIYKRT